MIRGSRAALLALALAAAGAAMAQDGRVSFERSALVTFTVAPEALLAAGACPACEPILPDPGTTIVLEVTRQNPHRLYTIDVLHDGWGTPVDMPLQAQYTVTSGNGRVTLLTTGWLPIDTAPSLVFGQGDVANANRVRVEVAYRLALRGDEPAGSFVTRVVHRVRENGTAVAHEVRVSLPAYLTLRVVGRTAGDASALVAFDYVAAPAAYLHAVTTGVPLGPSTADLVRVEVGTNHARGYTVTVDVEATSTPAGGPSLRDRLWIGGAAAQGRRFASSGPTAGLEVLTTGDDYALWVTGDEAPGAHPITVTYTAAHNP